MRRVFVLSLITFLNVLQIMYGLWKDSKNVYSWTNCVGDGFLFFFENPSIITKVNFLLCRTSFSVSTTHPPIPIFCSIEPKVWDMKIRHNITVKEVTLVEFLLVVLLQTSSVSVCLSDKLIFNSRVITHFQQKSLSTDSSTKKSNTT